MMATSWVAWRYNVLKASCWPSACRRVMRGKRALLMGPLTIMMPLANSTATVK